MAWNIAESWEAMRKDLPRKTRNGLDTLFLLVTWHIWKESNNRVFTQQVAPIQLMVERIKEEAKLWVAAGAKALRGLMPRE